MAKGGHKKLPRPRKSRLPYQQQSVERRIETLTKNGCVAIIVPEGMTLDEFLKGTAYDQKTGFAAISKKYAFGTLADYRRKGITAEDAARIRGSE